MRPVNARKCSERVKSEAGKHAAERNRRGVKIVNYWVRFDLQNNAREFK